LTYATTAAAAVAATAELQYHGSGAPLNPEDTGAGRASESTADKDASQPASETKNTPEAGSGSSGSGNAVNPPGFDDTAARDPEGGSFSGGDGGGGETGISNPSPGLPSTGSPVRGFSQD
jgi:hypothetical protein